MEYAEKNTDNEFGYFLLTAYDDMAGMSDTDDPTEADTKLELIKKLPRHMQERQALKWL